MLHSGLRVVAALVLFVCAMALPVAHNGCDGQENTLPIATEAPVFVRAIENGKLYTAGAEGSSFKVVHAYGSSYQMGKAIGELLKEDIHGVIPEMLEWINGQIDPAIHKLPKFLREAIEKAGTQGALEATYLLTKKYIEPHFLEEIRGLADGSDMDYNLLLRIHMFPELIKAACSMMGAWGGASVNGTLYQLRALDWATDGPFQKYPVVIVFHPEEGNGHAFSLLSFAGFNGFLTGFSSAPMGVCEKVWLHYNGTSSRAGYPWHFLLRDILQFDADMDSALTRIANAKRTCSIFVGLGDGHVNQFRGVEYSHDYIEIYDDINFPAYANHPDMNGLMYWDKGTQPSRNACMPTQLNSLYGGIDSETIIRQIVGPMKTGDLHAAVYDYANMAMFVSNASPNSPGQADAVPAYNRPWTRLDMAALFAEAQ